MRKPEWLKIKIPGGERYCQVKRAISKGSLHTVCQSARCPNVGECWESGTATFMILGDICTRGCAFCSVKRGNPNGAIDENEAQRVAQAAKAMGLDYVVVTSVTRDDLDDGGAGIFSQTVSTLKREIPGVIVEVLAPDYSGDGLEGLLDSKPGVFGHNIEVVERLTPLLRHQGFSYSHSLAVLKEAKEISPGILTKSSIMLGLGEREEEILSSMERLRRAGVDILVLGQYLQATKSNAPVVEYIEPDKFKELERRGMEMGFSFVASGPLVRTSYKAAEAFVKGNREKR